MHRESLSIGNLPAWTRLHNVEFDQVKCLSLPGDIGAGVVTTSHKPGRDRVLMRIPPELILSLDNIWIFAKSDRHLLQVLEAVGDYSRTARGAILIFLLLQLTNTATDGEIGVLGPFAEYIKFLPAQIPIPTFWSDEEQILLTGTSLEAALVSKVKSLDREFVLLHEKTTSIDWCRRHWWDDETGKLNFDDWKYVDAIYRSRALNLPGTGDAMVPCMDMANHATGTNTTAHYDTDFNGDAILVLYDDKHLASGEEVTITYGDDKGACEMLFSYGFVESSMTSAREIFLDLEIPEDDPLKLAKKAVAMSAPGFRLYLDGASIQWEGSFVWLTIVNEEDGLEVKLLQRADGERELQASWKDEVISDISKLQALVQNDLLWDVFNLRAIIILQSRVEQQLFRLEGSKERVDMLMNDATIKSDIRNNTNRIRDLEESLLLHAYEDFETKKLLLLQSPTVQNYLRIQETQTQNMSDEDFS